MSDTGSVVRLPPEADPHRFRSGALLVLFGAALWGTAGPLAQWLNAQHGIGPLTIALFRLALPVPLLVLAAHRLEGAWPWQGLRGGRASHALPLALPVAGAGLGLGLFQVLFFTGVAHVGGGPATLIAICLCPIATALLAAVVLGERLTIARLTALGLGLAGVALLVAEPPGTPPGDPVFGGLMAAASSLAFALLAVASRSIRERLAPLATVSLAFAVGTAVIAAAVLATGADATPMGPVVLGLMALLALGPTTAGYILFFRGSRRIPASTTGILVLGEPAAAMAIAALAFGDRFTAQAALGALLLAGAVVVITRDQ